MKPSSAAAAVAVAVALALGAGAGYWWATGNAKPAAIHAQAAQASAPDSAAASGKGKVLYYRNPMGLPDTSPVPKKDPMGMDYLPVYEGEQPQPGQVKISPDKVQKLGVRTQPAAPRQIARTVRAVGTLEVDESMLRSVSPKFEGWIERLFVNKTGDWVKAGQPLMEVYSPDLITAQQEYMVALKGAQALKQAAPDIQASMASLMESSLQRLRNWNISEEEISRLTRDGVVKNSLLVRSPNTGVVLEKPATQGMRFMPGEMLYKIADLSSLWLLAEIFEQDLALIKTGQRARIRVASYPDQVFEGTVSFVYPTVMPETRTARARVHVPNRSNLLKPAMYANVEIGAQRAAAPRLAIPESAVLDSGTRQLVLVQRGEGLFEPREVRLGMRGDGYAEVLDGLKQGDEVVVSANFLIDAESNLKAALGGFGGHAHGSAGAAATPPASTPITHSGEGTVEDVDARSGTVSIAHGPIPSLKWPAMTMEFRAKDAGVLAGLKPGGRIVFQIAEQAAGEWTIVRAAPLAIPGSEPGKPAAGAAHKAH